MFVADNLSLNNDNKDDINGNNYVYGDSDNQMDAEWGAQEQEVRPVS